MKNNPTQLFNWQEKVSKIISKNEIGLKRDEINKFIKTKIENLLMEIEAFEVSQLLEIWRSIARFIHDMTIYSFKGSVGLNGEHTFSM